MVTSGGPAYARGFMRVRPILTRARATQTSWRASTRLTRGAEPVAAVMRHASELDNRPYSRR